MLHLSHHADIAFSYAPGKIILVGEHAVVYGARAIAMPIEAGVRVAISQLSHHQIPQGPMIRGIGPFFMGEVSKNLVSSGPQILKNALSYLLDTFGESVRNIAIVVDGTLPPGRGLGSSASLSVALIRGLFRYFSWPLTDGILKKHALVLETIFHGSPSGIDHTVVIGEQVIGYKKEGDISLVWPITLKSPLKFLISTAGPHGGTKNAVKDLAERRKRHKSAYERIFCGLDEIACEMEHALIRGEHASVGELMNIAQGYLNALSLSTPEMEKLCAIARERGALGAKLTGAGGGGAMIALTDGNEEELLNAFRAAGYQSFITEVFDDNAHECDVESVTEKILFTVSTTI
jgi:hydroxymethylglutaryl-CoA reductase